MSHRVSNPDRPKAGHSARELKNKLLVKEGSQEEARLNLLQCAVAGTAQRRRKPIAGPPLARARRAAAQEHARDLESALDRNKASEIAQAMKRAKTHVNKEETGQDRQNGRRSNQRSR